MCNSAAHNSRPGRESLSKRLGRTAAQIKARDAHRCAYCGRTAAQSKAHLHLDHLQPKARGGADTATNLVLACRRCNSARKDLSLAQWARKAAAELHLSFTPAAIRAQAARALPTL